MASEHGKLSKLIKWGARFFGVSKKSSLADENISSDDEISASEQDEYVNVKGQFEEMLDYMEDTEEDTERRDSAIKWFKHLEENDGIGIKQKIADMKNYLEEYNEEEKAKRAGLSS